MKIIKKYPQGFISTGKNLTHPNLSRVCNFPLHCTPGIPNSILKLQSFPVSATSDHVLTCKRLPHPSLKHDQDKGHHHMTRRQNHQLQMCPRMSEPQQTYHDQPV